MLQIEPKFALILNESNATAWAARSETDLAGRSLDAANTPAKAQSLLLGDLLATETFRESVAIEAGLVRTGAAQGDREAAASVVGKRALVTALGPNLVGIKASAETPQVAQAIAQAILTQYELRSRGDKTRELQTVVDYFETQQALAQAELAGTRAEMVVYLTARPGVDKTLLDADYNILASRAEAQTKTLDRLTASLQDARLQAAAGGASSRGTATFSIQDRANLPAAPLGVPASKRLGYPLAAAFLGLLIGAAYIYLAFRADHTIRSRDDVLAFGLPVLGYIPDLQPREARLLHGYTPLRLMSAFRRDYARQVAASISPLTEERRHAS